MDEIEPFVDVHCHLLPDIDDGAKSWDESVAMAEMAVADGTSVIVCTPHQLGSYGHVHGEEIRRRTRELQRLLDQRGIPLQVLPGADVRIEDDLARRIHRGEILSLADRTKHVLLDLPHEAYVPIDGVLESLAQQEMTAVLSHPERNQGLLRDPGTIASLVDRGCLMQVTAESLLGTRGPRCQGCAEQMLAAGEVHLVATDGHSPQFRRPLLRRAFARVCGLVGTDTAVELFCSNPRSVVEGRDVSIRPRKPRRTRRFAAWFDRRRAG